MKVLFGSRSSRSQMFFKIGVFKLYQFSQENTCVGIFFNKVVFMKVFSGKICESFKNNFFNRLFLCFREW